MERKIALLRGINVGGKRIIKMEELRKMCESLGFKNVKTYIQSGNIVFDDPEESTIEIVELMIKEAIKKRFGFEVPVIVRTREKWREAFINNPFLEGEHDINQLHLTFLSQTPDAEKVRFTEGIDHSPDQFIIRGCEVYLKCVLPYHKTKLSNQFFEKKLGVRATNRNWKTVMKLVELSE